MATIDNYYLKSTGWKRKDYLHLRSATEVYWCGLKGNWTEKRRLHIVLSVLPIIPNIQLLSLYHAIINEAQQAIIFGLSTLRTLEVQSCQFHHSTRALPFLHVNTLKLLRNDMQTTRRLITISASTLETLEVHYSYGTGSILEGEWIKLPKLSTFTMKKYEYEISRAIWDTFKQYTSITTLHIRFHHNFMDISLHHSDFPALRSLTCDPYLAVSLIPNRPVTTYVEVLFLMGERLWALFNALSEARARITNLTLFVPDDFCSLLPSLGTSIQHVERLTLKFCAHEYLSGRSPYHLSRQPSHDPPGEADVILPKLKWVTISIDDEKSTRYPPELLLKGGFAPVCPALEVFEYLCFPFCDHGFDEPKRVWKVRRQPDGSWERQGPPPIPTPTAVPMPARTLHAAL